MRAKIKDVDDILLSEEIKAGERVYLVVVFKCRDDEFIVIPSLGIEARIKLFSRRTTYCEQLVRAGLKKEIASAIAELLLSWMWDIVYVDEDYELQVPDETFEDYI